MELKNNFAAPNFGANLEFTLKSGNLVKKELKEIIKGLGDNIKPEFSDADVFIKHIQDNFSQATKDFAGNVKIALGKKPNELTIKYEDPSKVDILENIYQNNFYRTFSQAIKNFITFDEQAKKNIHILFNTGIAEIFAKTSGAGNLAKKLSDEELDWITNEIKRYYIQHSEIPSLRSIQIKGTVNKGKVADFVIDADKRYGEQIAALVQDAYENVRAKVFSVAAHRAPLETHMNTDAFEQEVNKVFMSKIDDLIEGYKETVRMDKNRPIAISEPESAIYEMNVINKRKLNVPFAFNHMDVLEKLYGNQKMRLFIDKEADAVLKENLQKKVDNYLNDFANMRPKGVKKFKKSKYNPISRILEETQKRFLNMNNDNKGFMILKGDKAGDLTFPVFSKKTESDALEIFDSFVKSFAEASRVVKSEMSRRICC